MKNMYFYQPDIPTSIICWSFTGIVFLISMLLWLEITVFQIWTVVVLILFVIITAVQLYFRRLVFMDDKLVAKTVIPQNSKRILYRKIEEIGVKHGQVVIKTKFATYSFLLTPGKRKKIIARLKKLIPAK